MDGVGSGPTASRCAAEPWASKPATSGITQVCGVVGGPEAGVHAPALLSEAPLAFCEIAGFFMGSTGFFFFFNG